jgi:hypothetical protein
MVTYHYVKFYVFIIIQLEVVNINVRNFSFPIGFYLLSLPNSLGDLLFLLRFLLLFFIIIIILLFLFLLSFHGPWTCPRQISAIRVNVYMKSLKTTICKTCVMVS